MMTQHLNDKTAIARPDWLTRDVWPYDVASMEIDGEPIAYTDEGDGSPLLLVHDGMWSFVWGRVIGHLKDEFRVVTLDFPGAGLSPASTRPIGLESDSHLLEGFCDRLDLDAMTLVSHDLGGPVSLGLAARRPELIEGLVLVNTFAWPPHLRSLRAMLSLMGTRPITWIDTLTNLIPKLSSGKAGVGRNLSERERSAFVTPFLDKGPTRRFHQLMGSVGEEGPYLTEIASALGTTLAAKPVLTVFGERNDPFGFQARFKDVFPEVTEIVVAGGNHFPMCDDPLGFARWVSDWHHKSAG